MPAALLAACLLALFAALDALSGRLRGRLGALPLSALALALAFTGMEFARYDRGHPDWLLWIGFVGAPVVVIFGGAAWGVRRWYGWPDLGPVPGRLALVAAALLLGILVGSRVKEGDVEASMRRGDEIAGRIRAGSAGIDWTRPPLTSMGWLSPPPFSSNGRELSFPIGSGRWMTLDLSVPAKEAKWTLR